MKADHTTLQNQYNLSLRLLGAAAVLVASQLVALVTVSTNPLTFLWYALTVVLAVVAYARGRLFGLAASLIPVFLLGTDDILRIFVLHTLNGVPLAEAIWFWIFPLCGFVCGELGNQVRLLADQTMAATNQDGNFDPETGLPGRELFLHQLSYELAKARRRCDQRIRALALDMTWDMASATELRNNEWVSLLIIQILHYSDLEPIYGHDQKEYLIAAMVEELQSLCRPSDYLARVGPGQFALILSETPESGCQILQARLEAELGEYEVTTKSNQRRRITLGLRYGSASAPTPCTTVEALLDTAEGPRQHAHG